VFLNVRGLNNFRPNANIGGVSLLSGLTRMGWLQVVAG